MNEVNQTEIKRENIHKLKGYLDEKKISSNFAISLFSQFEKRGSLSDKQWDWVLKLVDQVDNPHLQVKNFRI